MLNDETIHLLQRRQFLAQGATSLGAMALSTLLAQDGAATEKPDSPADGGLPGLPHFAPCAKRVIYLFQSGAPSQLELFDSKPGLEKYRGTDLPDSIRQGQRLTGMTSAQKSFPIAPTKFKFSQHGQSGAWFSELLPNLAGVADELCVIKSLHTEAINHDPAITFITTGAQLAGRPSIGAWVSYGLGSENHDLPAFVAMVSRGTGRPVRSAALRPSVGKRLPAVAASRGEVSQRGRSRAVSVESARGRHVRPSAATRRSRASLIVSSSTSRGIPRSPRALLSTSWPIACKHRCPN